MKSTRIRFAVIIGIGLALSIPINRAFADADSEKRAFEESEFLRELSAAWQQWALSIPTSVNPQLEPNDAKAETCMVGQRGPIWFLAGVFNGGTAVRACSVPEGKALFFPVINSVNINTPDVCGQQGNYTAIELQAMSADFINAAANLLVQVDGRAITTWRRIRSEVFAVALPEHNIFDKPCKDAKAGNVPAGVYSPAVDDGYYVLLNPMSAGRHTLHFHAERPGALPQDVTYNLTVVPVLRN